MSSVPRSLAGSVAIVTGAGKGIGRSVALGLHRASVQVVATARTQSDLDYLVAASEPGLPQIVAVRGDAADPAAVAGTVRTALREFRRIDLLVNNAAISDDEEVPLWESDVDRWWQVVTVNLRGPMLFIHEVAPAMIAQGSGRIVNMNSGRAAFPLPTVTAYAAAKAGLCRVTATSAAALAGTGVAVFDLSPGVVRTPMTDRLPSIDSYGADRFTPVERTVEMILRIAGGDLDELSGRFLHARDDVEELVGRAAQIVRSQGRVLRIAPGYDGDHVAANQSRHVPAASSQRS